MVNLEATQARIEELNPMLMDIENQISASADQKARATLEGKRSELATEYNQQQAKEQELLAESPDVGALYFYVPNFCGLTQQSVGSATNAYQ